MMPIEIPIADAYAALAKVSGLGVSDIKAGVYAREIHLPWAKDDLGNKWVLREDLDAAIREINRRKNP